MTFVPLNLEEENKNPFITAFHILFHHNRLSFVQNENKNIITTI